jgi:hypothetical protein
MEITMAALLIGYFTAIAIVCLFLIDRQPHKLAPALNIAEER